MSKPAIAKVLAVILPLAGCVPPTAPSGPEPEAVAAAEPTGPCADERYRALMAVPLDSMTEREYEYYRTRDQACVEYQSERAAQAESAAVAREATETVDKASASLAAWLVVSTVVGLLTTLILVNG